MDPMPVKSFSITWRMIIFSMLMMCSIPSMYANKREVAVSLHDSADENIRIMIYQGEHNPVFMDKNQTYMVRVSSVIHFNVFDQQRGHSETHPIRPSTTSLVLKPNGLAVEVEQSSFLYSLYSSIAKLFFVGNE
jgi:hypothetical protein